MLCLGGFELYSRWVPLSIFPLCRRELVMILLLLTESVVALGMKFSTEESLYFVLPSAERVSSMN